MKLLGSGMASCVVAAISDDVVCNAGLAVELGADAVEVRLDMLDRVDDFQDLLSSVREQFSIPIIITNRIACEKGGWVGSEEERVKVLIDLLPLADAVDIELGAPLRDVVVSEAKRMGKTVIVSAHDFAGTPGLPVLRETLDSERAAGADIAKLAVMPHSPADVLNLLRAGVSSEYPVCIIAMGELGKHTRVIGGVYGSVLTYAYVGEGTAPGQLRVDVVKELMRTLV